MMVSFIDAILMRYSDANYFEQSSNCNIFIIGSLSPGKSGNHLILPPALCLNGCSINCAGSERKIKESCRNVEELDLGSNELTSLDEVLTIVKCLPNLRFLNLSENDLSNTTLPSSSHVTVNDNDQTSCNSFPELRSLVLNNTRIHWSAIVYLLQLMPKLTELHLSLNNYESVDIDRSIVKQFHHTRRLYISGNPNLSDWNEISRLVSVFPGLEVLTMADCNVQVIPRDLDNVLPGIVSLNISNWPIRDWEHIEHLNNMPQLTELRCQGLAVLDTINDVEARRHHLIARLPNVQILNGSEVSPDERLFAEKAFIRWHITNDHVEKPPKFYELRDIHGKVDPVAELSLAPRKYAKVTVESSLNCPEEVSGSPSDSDSSNDASSRTRTLELKLDLNKSVKEFKQQLSTIFNHPASQMKLFYVDRDMEGFFGPEEMRFAEKRLYTYSIQDGDKFIVDPK